MDNGNLKDAESGALNPDVASVKLGGKDNAAFAGVPQADNPKVLTPMGDAEEIPVDTRTAMAAYCDGVWEAAKSDRESNGIEDELVACLRQFRGKYTAEEEQELEASGFPKVYFPLSEHKVHTAVAWVDEFFSNGETLVNVKHTPIPEMETDIVKETFMSSLQDIAEVIRKTGKVPPAGLIQQYAALKRPLIEQAIEEEAQSKALRMEKVIHDDMIEGNWSDHIHNLIGYTCVYGTAGFRSPVIRIKRRNTWVDGKVKMEKRVYRTFEAVDPFDIFPAPGMMDTQEGNLCVRVRYNPISLAAYREVPLWIKSAVEEVLDKYGSTGYKQEVSSDFERRSLTAQHSTIDNVGSIEGYEFWGSVSGAMLHSIGMEEDTKKNKIANTSYDWYEVNAIVIAGKVVYCRIMESGEERPIDVVKFYDTPGSFWGRGPLQLIASLQRICNAAGRAIVMNTGFSALPQAIVDMLSMDPRDDMKMRPGKAWATRQNGSNPNSKPISFFTVESNAKSITDVFEFFQRLADEVTGIPAYANGTDAAVGAARTATGLNMLFGAANRGIKKVISNFDAVVKKAINRLCAWHMRYNPDESIKGDVNIEVTGLKYFSTKTARANDILNLIGKLGQDQRMAALQTPERLAKLMREIAISMDLPPETLAPTTEELRREQEKQRQQALAQQKAIEQEQGRVQGEELEKIDAKGRADARARAAGRGAGAPLGPQPTTTPKGRPPYASRKKGGQQ